MPAGGRPRESNLNSIEAKLHRRREELQICSDEWLIVGPASALDPRCSQLK